jgi:hypothetical protein
VWQQCASEADYELQMVVVDADGSRRVGDEWTPKKISDALSVEQRRRPAEVSFVSSPKMMAGANCRNALTLHEELLIAHSWRANCQTFRSELPTGVNPGGLFVRRGDRGLRTRWLCA